MIWMSLRQRTNFLYRGQLRNTIKTGEKSKGWPFENTVRGRYYLSQVLGRKKNEEAVTLETDAKKELDSLLKLDDTAMATRHAGDYPMLFDYLVHWENRLVTPRRASTSSEEKDSPEWC
jgi:hypothetical protein